MTEWTQLSWDEAMQRAYEALSTAEAIYEDMDSHEGRSNIDIEKHLRRAEVEIARAQTWFMMAGELARVRDRSGGVPR